MARRALKLSIAIALLATPASADVAYVTCQSGDALSVIDLDAPENREDWSVPGKPAGIAVSDKGDVYTVSADSKIVRRWDARTGEVLNEKRLEGGPIGVALDAERRMFYVSDWYNTRIWVLSATTLRELRTLPSGVAPAGLALSPDGAFLASADKDSNTVSIYSTFEQLLHYRFTVGTRPFGLGFAPDGRLFVGNVGSNDVSVIDLEARKIVATVPVGERPYGVSFAAGRAFISNQYANTVSVIDLASLETIKIIEVGEYPEGINATSDGKTVVVANWFDNTLSLIDTHTLSVLETLPTCDGPRAFGQFLMQKGISK